ncbi:MAG: aminodeoxychorismate/anthranilate synthase component II [Kiritimatiellae bacterium]|nr:aminodeoxychorismate/anthranilate synthase component II [Kiritimatiellia bacterium]
MILMIDNYDSFTYNLVQGFRGLGAEMQVVRNDEIDVDGMRALAPAAVILSPGPGNPDSAGVTMAAVEAFAGKVPMFGVCLGHQSIAQAFGGRIVHAKRLMHGKTSRIRHDGRGLFAGLPQDFEAMRYHSLAVERESLPECLEVSAESEDGEIMGLRHRTLSIESVQYHPESIGTPEGMRQMKNFIDRVESFKEGKEMAK